MAEEKFSPEALARRVAKFRAVGYGCSQTVLAIGMERLGVEEPNLLRAMEGYCGGACGGTCGALCGGAGLLGLYLGKGRAEEARSDSLKGLVRTLTEGFSAQWGASTCEGIIHGDEALHQSTCPRLMADTVRRVWDLLREHGFNPDSWRPGVGQ